MILLIDIIEFLSRFGTSVRVKVSLASAGPQPLVKLNRRIAHASTWRATIYRSLSNEGDARRPHRILYFGQVAFAHQPAQPGAAMRTYTFYFTDNVSPVRAFDIAECEDEPEARRWARLLLLREPERLAVEAWAGAQQVFELELPAIT